MIEELQAIKDAATPDDPETGEGMDLETARSLSDAYIAAHPEQFTAYESMDVKQLAHAVDILRSAGLEDEHWKAEAWLLHHYEPQNIGGVIEPQIRVVGSEG